MGGVVFDIKRFAVHDGPGIRTTVFLKGCPLRCRWCHNPESLEASPCELPKTYHIGTSTFTEMETVGREMSVEELMRELRKEKVFMDESGGGVTFSGGEPLFQPAFLKEMLMACKAEGMHTVVDTSGYAASTVLDSILPFTDLFLFDLKIIDTEIHSHWTGVGNSIILANFDRLISAGARVRVRIPLIPGVIAAPKVQKEGTAPDRTSVLEITVQNQQLPGAQVLCNNELLAAANQNVVLAASANRNGDLAAPETENLNAIYHFLEPYRDRLDGIDLLPFHNTAAHKYERLGLRYVFRNC